MSTLFIGTGNLGADPVTRIVQVDGESRTLVELSVFFPRRVPDGQGGYEDKGGFWREVAVWSPGLGERIMQHLRKGARVRIEGEERGQRWQDAEGNERESFRLAANVVTLDLMCVEQVTFAAGRRRQSDAGSPAVPA